MLPSNVIENFKKGMPFYFNTNLLSLVSWKELESIINLRPFMSDSRVRVLGEESYNWYASEWSTDPDTFPASILEVELKKYVFYIRDCSRINQQVNNICKEIEAVVNMPVDVHVYFSLIDNPDKTTHGFGIHRDKIDVMIIQSEGSSKFKLWDCDTIPSESTALIDTVLLPGTAVFIPAGFWHEIKSETKRISLSFAFGNLGGTREDRYWINLP